MRCSHSVLLVFTYGFVAASSDAKAEQTPTVSLEQSKVSYDGKLSGTVEHFHNIKFAEDTSGENRFAPPKPFTPASGTIFNASIPGPACPQLKDAMLPFFSEIGEMSEDCLNLHIARPANLKSTSNIPVVVWIHGGGVVKGSGSDPHSDPDRLIKLSVADGNPIIYMAINYRLNIFGFARLPLLTDTKSLNVGMRDQRIALEWVKDNIKSFGGDPNRITAYGLSAGGHFDFSADNGLWRKKGSSIPAGLDNAVAQKKGSAYGDIIPDRQSNLMRAGKFVKGLRMIFDWTQDDGAMNVGPGHLVVTEEDMKSRIQQFSHAFSSEQFTKLFSLYDAADFEEEKSYYDLNKESTDPDISVHYFRLSRILRDILFTCSSIEYGYHMVKHTRKDKNFDSDFSVVRLYDLNQSTLAPLWKGAGMPYVRVSHGSDTNYIFNGLCPELELSQEDKELSELFTRSFINFAYSGNPISESKDQKQFPAWPESYATIRDTDQTPHELNIQVTGGPYGTGSVHLTEEAEGESIPQVGNMQHLR
ncbi:hypothetical protein SBOR_1777 [Sclerotinia borealis F-4128]|uniref:Carboxylesterase type B domain-containing protein n=1 Tax=Sclerotinia borealis (strain F-4128) TaxID=1432307 RepID=W9CM41_SCLBF|nr:hypothetical protein SBOR_1777 [Sclerotinia borealis F-4128]